MCFALITVYEMNLSNGKEKWDTLSLTNIFRFQVFFLTDAASYIKSKINFDTGKIMFLHKRKNDEHR